MHNSLIPLLGVVVVCLLAVPLALHGPSRGSAGPEINPGVFRQVVNRVYRVDSMPLETQNLVTDLPAAAGAGPGYPSGRIVVVSGDDRSPLSAAVMLGLAESITAQGGAAILDPLRGGDSDTDHVLALGASWGVRVSCPDGAPPAAPGGACTATITCLAWPVRLADDHPAARLQPVQALRPLTVQVHHHSSGSSGSSGSWPGWYAAVGRSIADAVLADLARGAPSGPPELALPDWGSTLPQPATADGLRWSAAFQRAFIRGWLGRIDGVVTIGRTGNSESSLARLEASLARGEWHLAPSETPGYRLWSRDKDGGLLSVHSDPHGHDIVLWWERPHAAQLYTQWLSAAGDGIEAALEHQARAQALPPGTVPAPLAAETVRARARANLALYLDSEAIPLAYRVQARQLLAGHRPAPAPAAASAAP
jgi:hypothetical protein